MRKMLLIGLIAGCASVHAQDYAGQVRAIEQMNQQSELTRMRQDIDHAEFERQSAETRDFMRRNTPEDPVEVTVSDPAQEARAARLEQQQAEMAAKLEEQQETLEQTVRALQAQQEALIERQKQTDHKAQTRLSLSESAALRAQTDAALAIRSHGTAKADASPSCTSSPVGADTRRAMRPGE